MFKNLVNNQDFNLLITHIFLFSTSLIMLFYFIILIFMLLFGDFVVLFWFYCYWPGTQSVVIAGSFFVVVDF